MSRIQNSLKGYKFEIHREKQKNPYLYIYIQTNRGVCEIAKNMEGSGYDVYAPLCGGMFNKEYWYIFTW